MTPLTASTLFTLLANERRLAILLSLRDTPRGNTPSVLSTVLDIPLPNVSQHLAELMSGGLIKRGRSGRYVFYAPNSEVIVTLGRLLMSFEETPPCT